MPLLGRGAVAPSSPSLSCDADQSASADNNTDDDYDDYTTDYYYDVGATTSTTQHRDTSDHALSTTEYSS